MTNSNCIINERKQKRFRWLGHVFRMVVSNITKAALRGTPTGKRPWGRPKTTWHRTVETELIDMNMLGRGRGQSQEQS